MPISLTKIASNLASVTLSVEQETVTVVYYPGRVTEKSIAVLTSFSALNESTLQGQFKDFNHTFAQLIKSWDVYEDEAQEHMFPIEPHRLAELPITFRVQVMNAIMEDIRPNQVAPQMES